MRNSKLKVVAALAAVAVLYLWAKRQLNAAVHQSCLKDFETAGRLFRGEIYAGNLYSISSRSQLLDMRLNHVARTDFPIITDAILYYVGGNVKCEVGHDYLRTGNIRRMVVFEAHPAYAQTLSILFGNSVYNSSVVVNDFGLGSSDRKLKIADHGAGTSVVAERSKPRANDPVAVVKEACEALRNHNLAGGSNILYTNCEGCELEVLENLLTCDLVKHFAIIHVATHMLPGVNVPLRFCQIRSELLKTHAYLYGASYAQERWVRHTSFPDQ